MKRLLLIGLFLTGSLMVALAASISHIADKPGPLKQTRALILPEGTGIIEIGVLMEQEGVIRSRYLFPFYYMLLEYYRPLRAGEYEFAAGASYRQVMRTLGLGKTVVRKFTVPEGLTVAEVYRLLADNPALKGDLPGLMPEGTLLPETYHYSYGDTRRWLIERMRNDHTKFMASVWGKRAKDLPFTTEAEALTLASIVEKETGIPSERGQVAAVYINRLRKGMRLQADPTVIYGITLGQTLFERSITRNDLNTPTPYNTYTQDGLPPTPIANPGKDAIRAVLNPPQTKDLFFVADGKGGHIFSETYAQHDKHVDRYRALMRAKESAPAPIAPAPVPMAPAQTKTAPSTPAAREDKAAPVPATR